MERDGVTLVQRQSMPDRPAREDAREFNFDNLDQQMRFVPEIPPPKATVTLFERFPTLFMVVFMAVKYNIVTYLFEYDHPLIGTALLLTSTVYMTYRLVSCIERYRWGVFLSVVIWLLFVYWQTYKYKYLYDVFRDNIHFRMYLWQLDGELIDPQTTVLLAIHLDAAMELLCLHLIAGLLVDDFDTVEGYALRIYYRWSLFYFFATLPIDFSRPRYSEAMGTATPYLINSIAIPIALILAFLHERSAEPFQNRRRYWITLLVILSHPIYEILTYSALKIQTNSQFFGQREL